MYFCEIFTTLTAVVPSLNNHGGRNREILVGTLAWLPYGSPCEHTQGDVLRNHVHGILPRRQLAFRLIYTRQRQCRQQRAVEPRAYATVTPARVGIMSRESI